MPYPETPSDSLKPILAVSGLNERERFANTNPSEFDFLRGLIPQRKGVLQRANGTKYLLRIPGKRILGICQTLDSRQNVLIQTDSGVYLYSEDEIFGRVPATNLLPVVLTEEDTMAKALIMHSVAPGTNGGTYTTANVWQQAPLTAIVYQRNADGTAAAFVTALAANQFTLAAGGYRFLVHSVQAPDAVGHRCLSRLYNVTAAAAAWVGALNEQSAVTLCDTANGNTISMFTGEIDILVPTIFEIQNFCSKATANTGFGFPRSLGAKEVYRWIEIIQTHA